MIYVVAAGFIAGQLAVESVSGAVLATASAALVCGLVGWCGGAGRRPGVFAAAFAVAVSLGGALVAYVERRPAAPTHVANLPLPWRGEVVAVVRGEPVRRPGKTIVVAEVECVGSGTNARGAHGLVRLTLRRHRALHDGDRLRAWVTLRRPRSFRSPGVFDFSGYLARRGIHVVGSVWDRPALARLGRRPGRLRAGVARWRRAAERALVHGVRGPTRDLLSALVLGRGQALTAEMRDRFARAGVLHVLVVSGLHITLVAGLTTRLVEALLGRSERILLATDVTRMARFVALVPVFGYLVLVGPSVSVARAVVASALAVAAMACGRRVAPLRLWAFALVLVAAVWPGTPGEAAFQLSFASVGGVLLAMRRDGPAAVGAYARVRQMVAIAWTVTIVTAPVMALHFDALAPMGILANPLVVPLFGSAVLGPGLAAAVVAPFSVATASWLFALAGWLVQPGLALVWSLGDSWAVPLRVPRPNPLEVLALYAALAGWYGRHRRPWKTLGVAALAVLAVDATWWVWERTAPGRLRVAFLDVGQGDAAVVELPDGRVLAVDAGGFPGSDFDPGRAVVEPYLRTRKIRRVDALVMSHAHPDHAGGLPRLIERFAPREFWWAGQAGSGPAWRAVRAALERHGVAERTFAASDSPPGFAAVVTILHPPQRWAGGSMNDSSLVVRVAAEAVAVLLSGDIETRAEAALGGSATLASDVVKVPHHGSRTSSTPGWVAAVQPRLAVISVGAQNAYGLPAGEVEARYAAHGACVLRTDRCGTIVVDARAGAIDVRTMEAARACRCEPDQVVAPRPLRSAYMTRPTRSRTPSF